GQGPGAAGGHRQLLRAAAPAEEPRLLPHPGHAADDGRGQRAAATRGGRVAQGLPGRGPRRGRGRRRQPHLLRAQPLPLPGELWLRAAVRHLPRRGGQQHLLRGLSHRGRLRQGRLRLRVQRGHAGVQAGRDTEGAAHRHHRRRHL
ncbi:unnamed protein product, partial [Gulo gulo]